MQTVGIYFPQIFPEFKYSVHFFQRVQYFARMTGTGLKSSPAFLLLPYLSSCGARGARSPSDIKLFMGRFEFHILHPNTGATVPVSIHFLGLYMYLFVKLIKFSLLGLITKTRTYHVLCFSFFFLTVLKIFNYKTRIKKKLDKTKW